MNRYGTVSDDYYLNLNLGTEMDLPTQRETLVHYFEQIQKKFPLMRNFYGRERSEFVLEEDKSRGHYRWASVEPRRVSAGHINPSTFEEALQIHRTVLELAPFALALSPLDCESVNVMLGFDYTYRGNHNQLLADVLGVSPAVERMMEIPGARVVAYEPALQVALDDDCRVQCRLSVETRTTAYHVRTGEFPEEQLSIYLTARHYGGLAPGDDFVTVFERLAKLCRELVDDCVFDQILRPLQQAIALK